MYVDSGTSPAIEFDPNTDILFGELDRYATNTGAAVQIPNPIVTTPDGQQQSKYVMIVDFPADLVFASIQVRTKTAVCLVESRPRDVKYQNTGCIQK